MNQECTDSFIVLETITQASNAGDVNQLAHRFRNKSGSTGSKDPAEEDVGTGYAHNFVRTRGG